MDFTEEEKRCIFKENSDTKNPTKLHDTSTYPEPTADTTPPTTSPQPEEFHIDTSTRPQIQSQQLATSTDAYISSPTGIEAVDIDDEQFGDINNNDNKEFNKILPSNLSDITQIDTCPLIRDMPSDYQIEAYIA